MAKFELVLRHEGRPSEQFEVPPQGLSIGRQEDNDIFLNDQLVSRRHARVWIEEESLWIEDLDSRNGIEVNGAVVKQTQLRAGDQLRVGQALFHVMQVSDSQLGRTVISQEYAAELYLNMVSDTRSARLPMLYKAAQLLGSVFDQDELLHQILALIFQALPVQRGFVILKPAGEEAQVMSSLSREPAEESGPPLSHTLIQHVFDSRDAMLTLDAQVDDRFDNAESIMGHGIHSAMCVPLLGRAEVVGAIYVDSGSAPRAYTKDDLELLVAIARVVGVAVENARLYQENVHQARLAAIGQATAGVGHCVKNILTGIHGGADFVKLGLDNQDFKYIGKGWPILQRSVERIEALVTNMLSFSKERAPERLPCDMNALIREVLEVVRERADKAGIALLFDGRDIQRVEVDQQEIFRVLMNLVMNAIEACKDGGEIRITCVSQEEGCTLTIADTGCGIPEDILPRLSQAFVSSKGSGGTGLGLACSYKIVREHGGDIQVSSTPGEGTQFTVYLPHVFHAPRPTEPFRQTVGQPGK